MKTIKLIILVTLMIVLVTPADSQIYQQWEKTVNGSINNEDSFWGSAVDDSGNVYLTGTIYNSPTGKDIIVRKYNPAGDLVWQNDYSTATPDGEDRGVAILYKNGFVYVAGDVETAPDVKDIIVMKRDAITGNLLWSKHMREQETEMIMCLRLLLIIRATYIYAV
jgi:hypothetical protein